MKSQRRQSALWISSLIGLIAVLIIGAVIAQVAARNNPQNLAASASESPSPAPTEEPSPTDWPTPDETATEYAIATALQWKEFVAATAQQLLTDQPLQNPPRPTGILEFGGDAFPSELYRIQNAWQNVRDGQWFQVYAGAYVQDPEQGIVIAAGVPHDVVFETPVRVGSVRIIDEANFRLTLMAEDGTIFYFDVPGLRFVDSLTEIVPTITPFLSATPTTTYTPSPTDTPLPTCTPGPTPTANPSVPFVCN